MLKNIVLIPVHATPWDTERELDELYEVFLVVKDKWKTDVSGIINRVTIRFKGLRTIYSHYATQSPLRAAIQPESAA